jgi:putative tryptophan/tyrosine transport system substrate-binding protein
MMRRREFVALVGGAAVGWPLAVRAQQPERLRQVGVLIGNSPNADDPFARQASKLIQEAMQGAGWVDGKNIHVEYRFGAGDPGKISAAAAELVSIHPNVIYAVGGIPAAKALQAQTRTIPIVFTQAADPVGFGLVASVTHPGGNITGFTVWDLSIGGKWIDLLREIAPGLDRIGIMYNPDTTAYAPSLVASAKAAVGHDLTVLECIVHNDNEIDATASSLGSEPHSGLLVIAEPFINAHQDQIIAVAAQFCLPTLVPLPGATRRGALISYTYTLSDMIKLPISYIDRILKGEVPGDLPVQAPTKFELSINLKTAKTLGLNVSPSLLAIADEVIE